MRVKIVAVGRAKSGPERQLCEDYISRALGFGRQIGLTSIELVEVDGATTLEEGKALLRAAGQAHLILLDERGTTLDSVQFSKLVGDLRDDGTRDLVLAIGGADGHAPQVRQAARKLIAFGKMTWPHMLVRVMLSEQVFRAATILAGHPYHRGG